MDKSTSVIAPPPVALGGAGLAVIPPLIPQVVATVHCDTLLTPQQLEPGPGPRQRLQGEGLVRGALPPTADSLHVATVQLQAVAPREHGGEVNPEPHLYFVQEHIIWSDILHYPICIIEMVREKNIEVPNTDQENKDGQQMFSIACHQHHSFDFEIIRETWF